VLHNHAVLEFHRGGGADPRALLHALLRAKAAADEDARGREGATHEGGLEGDGSGAQGSGGGGGRGLHSFRFQLNLSSSVHPPCNPT
jgi:hypothetical protein